MLLFSCTNKNFLFWHLSNDCQIARPALVSGPPNRKKSYNKHLISLVFSVRSVKYGSSFFPSIYGPRTSRLGHKSMEKNSVRNLSYGPKTRLIRGIYHLRQESIEHCLEHCFSWPAGHLHLVDEQTFWWHLRCYHFEKGHCLAWGTFEITTFIFKLHWFQMVPYLPLWTKYVISYK